MRGLYRDIPFSNFLFHILSFIFQQVKLKELITFLVVASLFNRIGKVVERYERTVGYAGVGLVSLGEKQAHDEMVSHGRGFLSVR